MTDIATAEMLWVRAHDAVRRGELASAVKDLSRCYEILHAQNDPRVYEVHRRWTEVHQMYLEDGAREPAPAVDAENTLEKQAEAKANAGDLDGAIALYQQAADAQPHNELVSERLHELIAAKRRADELTGPKAAAPASAPQTAQAPAAPAPSIASVDPFQAAAHSDPANVDVVVGTQTAPVLPKHSFEPAPLAEAAAAPDPGADDWSDVALTPDPEPQVPVRAAAPVMNVDDAPVGMPSLELTVDLGDELTDDLSSEPTTETVAPAAAAVVAKNPFDSAFDSVKIDSDEGAAAFGDISFSSDGVPGAAAAHDPSLARMALLEQLLAHVQRVRAERASGAAARP
jgi:hypothetical protein